jgi:hypothetical protein
MTERQNAAPVVDLDTIIDATPTVTRRLPREHGAPAVILGEHLEAVLAETTERFKAESDERVAQLVGRVRAIKKAKIDMIAKTPVLEAVPLPADDDRPGQVVMKLPNGMTAIIGEVAHDHLSDRLGIERRYYKRMNAEAPELLATNINWWLTHTPDERMLRMLGPAGLDETKREAIARAGARLYLRAMMGKSYRTIDDADLVDAILPALMERGAMLRDFSIDERRLHAKFTTAPRSIEQIRAQYAAKYGIPVAQIARHAMVDGKDVSFVNEVLSTGVYIRHSEIGFASLTATMYDEILKCLNAYVARDNEVDIRHVGKKQTAGDDDIRELSDTTVMLDNAALLSRVHDKVDRAFSEEKVLDRATAIAGAKLLPVERPDKPLFSFIGDLGAALELNEDATEVLKEETARAVAEEGGEVRFAFVQGITATAKRMTNYDQRVELERVGYEVLHDDPSLLVRLARDGAEQTRRVEQKQATKNARRAARAATN